MQEKGRNYLTQRISRRQVIKAGGLATLGLVFSKPVIETIRPTPVFAGYGGSGTTGTNQMPPPTDTATLVSIGTAKFISRKDEEQDNGPPGAGGDLTVVDLTDTNLSGEDLANTLIGDAGILVPGSVSFTGDDEAAGIFSGGNGIIGFDSGIVLGTGKVKDAVGPNLFFVVKSNNNGTPGDSDLRSLNPNPNPIVQTFDAAVLEFDFVPTNDMISFQYVFASEEYNAFVNSPFNDVFGFFLENLTQGTPKTNVALIPGTTTEVSINTVNGGNPFGFGATNPEFYRNNDPNDGGGSINTSMNGLTVALPVEAEVVPGDTYHIKLAIADMSDGEIDSNVFIRARSFVQGHQPDEFIETALLTVPGQTLASLIADGITVELSEQVCGGEFSSVFLPAASFVPDGGQVVAFDGAVVDTVTQAAVSATVNITELQTGSFEMSLHFRNADYTCLQGTDNRLVTVAVRTNNDIASGAQCFERSLEGDLMWPPGPGVVCT